MTRSGIPFKICLGLLFVLMLWEIYRDLIWPLINMLLVLALVFVLFSLSAGTSCKHSRPNSLRHPYPVICSNRHGHPAYP